MASFTAKRRHLTALRLSAQGIARPAAATPLAVVEGMLAVQAQDYPGALWSIGLRTASATLVEVEAAQDHGEIVRSWPMRGTLHFVAAVDLGWMLQLTSARMLQSAEGRRRQLGLDSHDFVATETTARRLLAGGAHLSRAELLAGFDADGVSTAGQRGVHLLGRLAQSGVIVLTGQSRYGLLEEWVPHPTVLDRDAALHEIALRYFCAHGPATLKDFSWWSSLTLTEARAGIALARAELETLEIDGVEYLHRPGLELAKPGVHLLPGFDEYLLGYSDRSAPLAGEASEIIVPGANGMFLATIVVNGEVVGSWRRTARARRVDLALSPFGTLTAANRAGVEKAARRYGRFVGSPVEVAG